ncbi:sigma-70 family RNA polymerase sigma factor [Pseudenhygromyxa sp. WMMC2535]|uniref:RNA polymerase sigma factor n=1 Tax=Pseudenhygromyxa sp. WMMC2535 TaxID=2712867 RepID=UPI001555EE37|nr:sigma-70 family RNA polymerase sigma factor [Pseudenhygromyxa sp. WMMC2535]NVB41729.1 sigma-70 family RNA polymerase sigma factor [Pseudenhygromyxa sp. WMMC2535]
MAINVEAAYRRYGPMVLRRCRSMLRDEQQATDAMQDVFVQLLRSQDRLEDRGMSSLLYRMATNICLNRLRSRRRRPEDASSDLLGQIVDATGGAQEERIAARSLLDRALGREPVSTATIAVLHLHDGMTLQEVADAVGLSVSGVRKRLRKVKANLEAIAEPIAASGSQTQEPS